MDFALAGNEDILELDTGATHRVNTHSYQVTVIHTKNWLSSPPVNPKNKVQTGKFLPCKHGALDLIPRTHIQTKQNRHIST